MKCCNRDGFESAFNDSIIIMAFTSQFLLFLFENLFVRLLDAGSGYGSDND